VGAAPDRNETPRTVRHVRLATERSPVAPRPLRVTLPGNEREV